MVANATPTSISVDWSQGVDTSLLGSTVTAFKLEWRALGRAPGGGPPVSAEEARWQSSDGALRLRNLRCVKGGLAPATYYTFRVMARGVTEDGPWGASSKAFATLMPDGGPVQGPPPPEAPPPPSMTSMAAAAGGDRVVLAAC